MTPYKSCRCRACKSVSSTVKAAHKKAAHRGFRRASRLAILRGAEVPNAVAAGYRA